MHLRYLLAVLSSPGQRVTPWGSSECPVPGDIQAEVGDQLAKVCRGDSVVGGEMLSSFFEILWIRN